MRGSYRSAHVINMRLISLKRKTRKNIQGKGLALCVKHHEK